MLTECFNSSLKTKQNNTLRSEADIRFDLLRLMPEAGMCFCIKDNVRRTEVDGPTEPTAVPEPVFCAHRDQKLRNRNHSRSLRWYQETHEESPRQRRETDQHSQSTKKNYFATLMETEEGRALRRQWSTKPCKTQGDQEEFLMATDRKPSPPSARSTSRSQEGC